MDNITTITPAEREELRILRAAMWDIATTAANSNSDPDIMACALDHVVATAQGALKQAQEAQRG